MVALYTPEKVRSLDSEAISTYAIPSIVLMENAVLNAFEILQPIFDENIFENIAIICGKGNNGGDGYALARHLANAAYQVTVISLFPINQLSGDAAVNARIVENYARNSIITLVSSKKFTGKLSKGYDVVIDAMLGSGFSGNLADNYVKVVKTVNKYEAFKVALDIPTGLNADTGYGENIFQADVTVTFGGLKQGLFFNDGKKFSGEVFQAGIGVNDSILENLGTDTFLLDAEEVEKLIPVRPIDVHKYQVGKVFHCTGSGKYPGAGVLTALSSFKVGAGASVLAAGSSYINRLLALAEPHLVFEEFDDNQRGTLIASALPVLLERIAWADCVVLGSGLGNSIAVHECVQEIVKQKDTPMVIDADAIKTAVSLQKSLTNCILTPHLGEFSKVIGLDTKAIRADMLGIGRAFAKQYNCVLVLKDFVTLIFTPQGTVYINSTGNSGLAKFGSGDVLAGMIGGFFAQTKNAEKAAILGVFIHGLTADILASKKSISGYTATDLLASIPDALHLLLGARA